MEFESVCVDDCVGENDCAVDEEVGSLMVCVDDSNSSL